MTNFKTNITATLFLAVFFLLPSTSHAYLTTDQTATQLNDTTILYTITYEFGSDKYDMTLPIGAVRSTEDSPYVTYDIIEDDRIVFEEGSSASLVLSTATITDNMYFIPKGEQREFTFVSLVTIPADRPNLDLSLQLTALPFTLTDDETTRDNGLNDSELQYYVTPVASY